MNPKFICVCRSGGDFTSADAIRLKRNVADYTTVPYDFICLSDSKLIHKWEGWWSKIEAFRFTGAVVYADLDTVFVDSIDCLFEMAMGLRSDIFAMNKAFNESEIFSSGLMLWNGDWTHVYEQFSFEFDAPKFMWDQRYIKSKLSDIITIQSKVSGIYSYKHHVRENGLPEDARIILFHGKPRPSEVHEEWI